VLLIVCSPGWSRSVEAGKKRRDGSLERLRERNAGERWKSLQKMWRPLSEDAPTSSAAPIAPGAAQQEPVPPSSLETQPVFVAPQSQPTPLPSSPRKPQAIGPDDPSSAEPAWVFDEVTEDGSNDLPAESGDPLADESAALDLRPISSILPYYDYVPEGTPEDEQVVCRPDSPGDLCPQQLPLPDVAYTDRAFADIQVAWEPSNLFANPLYFEDAALERYGHTHNCFVQPFASVGKFGVQLVGLPYQMALHPIHEHRYALGWYRPGECAPYKYYLPPWNAKAALTAGAAYTGLFFLIP